MKTSLRRFTTRPASEDDYDFLYGLHVAALKDYVAQSWGWEDTVQERMFREGFDPSKVEILVVDGRDVGVLSLERRDDEIFISSIEILPEWQNRGLGTAVIQNVRREARNLGLPVGLRVLKVNPARRLYKRLGFSVVEETATHFWLKHGYNVRDRLHCTDNRAMRRFR